MQIDDRLPLHAIGHTRLRVDHLSRKMQDGGVRNQDGAFERTDSSELSLEMVSGDMQFALDQQSRSSAGYRHAVIYCIDSENRH